MRALMDVSFDLCENTDYLTSDLPFVWHSPLRPSPNSGNGLPDATLAHASQRTRRLLWTGNWIAAAIK